jgi:hypothetical protein
VAAFQQQQHQEGLQALLQRGARMQSEVQKHKGVLDGLKTKYTGRSGRYSGADQKAKLDADAALKHLREGRLPEEVDCAAAAQPARRTDVQVLEHARTDPAAAARLAGASSAPVGR